MGGKLFNNTECILSDIAPKVQQDIINELLAKYPNLVILPIGSTGKKPFGTYSSDIDIAIQCKDINELREIIDNVFDYSPRITNESIYIVSIAYPYNHNNETKYVQCDFMIMWDKDYTAFRYKCPNYINKESNYKVGAKIMFANMILNHCNEAKLKNLPDNFMAKFDFRPTALYRFIIDIKNEIWKEDFVSIDPYEIAGFAFYDSNIFHFDSVETLWKEIHSNNFKYPNETKSIEMNFFKNCWRKGWTSIVPEDFKLQYWTNEEIWKEINEQKFINKINQIIQNGREI